MSAEWVDVAALALGEARRDLGPLMQPLIDEAIAHFVDVAAAQPGRVAAVELCAVVFRALSRDELPRGLLGAAAATYLAFDVLDDHMDGDPPTFWPDRSPSEIIIGAQLLLIVASQAVAEGQPANGDRMRLLYRNMVAKVAEGQLRTEDPLTATTTPSEVLVTLSSRSGAMLAGFAELAATAACGGDHEVAAARTFGHELAVARQHLNDLTELVGRKTTDLRNRTATMATAMAVQASPPSRRGALVTAIHAAADNPHLRQRLVQDDLAGAIADVAALVHLHLGRARLAAALLSRDGVRETALERMIMSTFTSPTE